MTTIENNKLIAEFMGINLQGGGRSVFDEVNLKYFRKTTYEQDGLCKFCHNHVDHGHHIKCYVLDTDKLAYHSSWDWLMPVVEKIETFNHAVTITQNICTIRACIMGDSTVRAHQTGNYKTPDTKLYNTWLAVVEFIKWYNSNKDNNG